MRLGAAAVFTDVTGTYRFVNPPLLGDQVVLIDDNTNNTPAVEFPSGIPMPVMIVAGQDTGTRWAYTASGPTTNIAARLSGLADGGGIVISEETRKRLGDEFPVEDMGPQQLKNVPQPVRTYRLAAAAQAGALSPASA